MADASTEGFESLVSKNSNLEEVQEFIRGPESKTIAPEMLLHTLDACVTLLRQKNMHSDEHENLIATLQSANAELKRLVSSTQARLDEHLEDNSALVATLGKVTNFQEQITAEHERRGAERAANSATVQVLQERIRVLTEDHDQERRNDKFQISQLRARLSAMHMMGS